MGWPGFIANQPKRYFKEEKQSKKQRIIETKKRHAANDQEPAPEKQDLEVKAPSSSGRMLSHGIGHTPASDDRGEVARFAAIGESRERDYASEEVAPTGNRDLEAEADETEHRAEVEETATKRIDQASRTGQGQRFPKKRIKDADSI